MYNVKGSVPNLNWAVPYSLVMARKLRVEYPGAIYHVMNRGDRREAIFKDDDDQNGSPISVSGQEGKRIPVSQPFFS
jgi:hypothetical protein